MLIKESVRSLPRVLSASDSCKTPINAMWVHPDTQLWGNGTAAINYLKKVCLETAMPSTWIHFNCGSGHICLGTSNPLWVTLTYDIWTENKGDCSECVVLEGVSSAWLCCRCWCSAMLTIYSSVSCCTDEKLGCSSDLAHVNISISQLLALIALTLKGLMKN